MSSAVFSDHIEDCFRSIQAIILGLDPITSFSSSLITNAESNPVKFPGAHQPLWTWLRPYTFPICSAEYLKLGFHLYGQ